MTILLIDFFHTHRGHVLKDFAKLENDLLYIYTPIESEDDLVLAYRFTDFLVSLDDPYNPPVSLPEIYAGTAFERSYQCLRHLRKLASTHIRDDHPHKKAQWLVPQLRYAVHTIGFDEPNKLQRIWALYTSCQASKALTAQLTLDETDLH